MSYHKEKRLYYAPPMRYAPRKGFIKMISKLSLEKAIEGFILSCQARKLSENTLVDYRRTLNKFIKHIGNVPICDIKKQQVEAFLAAQPFKEKTVLNYHIGLSSLWTWALSEGYVETHILRQISKPRPQKIAVRPFSDVEVRAMMSSVKRNADRDRAVILILLDTGLRATELCSLTIGDIDLSGKKMKVLGKGNKERLLPFSNRTASAIFRYISTNNCNPSKPFNFTRTSLAHLVKRIGNRAGISGVHPHRFRHTFAINYLRNGGDPYTLQAILGHTTLDMVKTYLALAQVDVDAVHKRASPVENWRL